LIDSHRRFGNMLYAKKPISIQIDSGSNAIEKKKEVRVNPEGNTIRAFRSISQTPLDRYLARKQIIKTQYDAGQAQGFTNCHILNS